MPVSTCYFSSPDEYHIVLMELTFKQDSYIEFNQNNSHFQLKNTY